MISIPLGTVEIQVERQATRRAYIEALQAEVQHIVQVVVGRCLEAVMEAEVTAILGREWYEKRDAVPRQASPAAQCNRCKTHAAWLFSRDGHYPRQLGTHWGQINFAMPQVTCECGGSVKIDYQTVRPRQRIWDDVEEAIRERYGWGESLRAIKASLDRLIGSSLGLRTINERVHALATLVPRWRSSQQAECPPVVRIDGVWVPQMQATGKYQNDALGRHRAVKSGTRRPVLVAQGVWPASGRQEIVAWVLRDAEGREDWLALLNQMWDRGIRPQRGLKLLTADGSAGLPGAHQEVYWNVPLQRCVFHKLRNIWRDLVVPPGLASKAAKAYKRRLIRSAAHVWQAARLSTARERHTAWCLTWESEQPDAVATMRRDFEATVSFYDVQAAAKRRGLMWPATHLRTTSHIERLFRAVRRRIRQAIVLHSSTGVLALAHQCFTRWTAGQAASLHERSTWPRQLERALAAPAIS